MAIGSDDNYYASGNDNNGNVCSDTAGSSCYNCGCNYYYNTSCIHDTPPGDSLYTKNYSSGYD